MAREPVWKGGPVAGKCGCERGALRRPRVGARGGAWLQLALSSLVCGLIAGTAFFSASNSTLAEQVGARVASSPAEASGTVESSATPETSSTPATHTVRVIGRSLKGRAIVMETFGTGPRRVLLLGGVHGNEYGAPVAEAFARYVRAHPSVVPSGTEFDIVACANPDGRAKRRRTNAQNVDLNRNFPSRNWTRKRGTKGASPGARRGSEPETRVLVALLESQRYSRVVSLHSRGGLLDWDGPGGWTLAKRMSKASRVRMRRLPAYHGSMGSYVPERYHVGIVTWELARPTMNSRVRTGLLAALR